MMKKILIIPILFILVHCQKSTKRSEESNHKEIVNFENQQFQSFGFQDKYDLNPPLTLKETTESEFKKYDKQNHSIINATPKMNRDNFYLETNHKILQFKKENDNSTNRKEDENRYEYLGFYPSLNMYAVSSNTVSEGLGFSNFELINKASGKISKIMSPGDDRIDQIFISPNNSHIAYFYNQIYDENNSFIGVLESNADKDYFKESRSFMSDQFNIHQLVWAGKNTILVKVTSDNARSFKYYKIDILH